MPDAPVTDGLVSLWVAVLSVVDAVLDHLVDLSAAEPLTSWGSDSVGVLAEIAVNTVEFWTQLVGAIVLSAQTGGV